MPWKSALNVNVKLLLSICCTSPTIWDPAESTVVTAGNLDKLCAIGVATPAWKFIFGDVKFLSVLPVLSKLSK